MFLIKFLSSLIYVPSYVYDLSYIYPLTRMTSHM